MPNPRSVVRGEMPDGVSFTYGPRAERVLSGATSATGCRQLNEHPPGSLDIQGTSAGGRSRDLRSCSPVVERCEGGGAEGKAPADGGGGAVQDVDGMTVRPDVRIVADRRVSRG